MLPPALLGERLPTGLEMMIKDDKRFAELSRLCWEAVSAKPCAVSNHQVDVPDFVPIDEPTVDGRYADDFPVLRHLDEALELTERAGFSEITQSIAELRTDMRWSQNAKYTRENCGQSLLDGYAYSPLTGPDGPIHAAAPRGGFYLMGPNVLYPDHNHGPREVYFIFSGGVQWRLDQGEWFDVAPGTMIYHKPWQMHGMRSSDRPVLAFAGWVEPGDRLGFQFSATASDDNRPSR